MKAKIIDTGEIINFLGSSVEHGTMTWIDSKNIYHQGILNRIELLEDYSTINWEQRKYELTKTIIGSLLSSSEWQKLRENGFLPSKLVSDSIEYADEAIKQLMKDE